MRRGTLVPKDLIAEALWPDDPRRIPRERRGPGQPIRRALGDRTLIRTGPGGYVLADGGRCWVDAEAFLDAVQAGRAGLAVRPAEALTSFRAALGIWRGDRSPKTPTPTGRKPTGGTLPLPAWKHWTEPRPPPWTARAPQQRRRRAAGPGRRSRPSRSASPRCCCWSAPWPRPETRPGALGAFDEYRDRLTAETGLEPTPQARQIRQRILAGQPADGKPRPRHISRPAGSHGSLAGRGDPFLGRYEECALIADAAAGRGTGRR